VISSMALAKTKCHSSDTPTRLRRDQHRALEPGVSPASVVDLHASGPPSPIHWFSGEAPAGKLPVKNLQPSRCEKVVIEIKTLHFRLKGKNQDKHNRSLPKSSDLL
jgi:hypothetical protein